MDYNAIETNETMHWNELLSHAKLIQNVNHYQIPKRKKFKSVSE